MVQWWMCMYLFVLPGLWWGDHFFQLLHLYYKLLQLLRLLQLELLQLLRQLQLELLQMFYNRIQALICSLSLWFSCIIYGFFQFRGRKFSSFICMDSNNWLVKKIKLVLQRKSGYLILTLLITAKKLSAATLFENFKTLFPSKKYLTLFCLYRSYRVKPLINLRSMHFFWIYVIQVNVDQFVRLFDGNKNIWFERSP